MRFCALREIGRVTVLRAQATAEPRPASVDVAISAGFPCGEDRLRRWGAHDA